MEAFYTTALLKGERALLALAGLPSSDDEARQLAEGTRDAFAAWRVEGREANQLLLRAGRTRSWLMAAPENGASATRLYFGSAVVGRPGKEGKPELGFVFHALLGFHRIYSRALLHAASRRAR